MFIKLTYQGKVPGATHTLYVPIKDIKNVQIQEGKATVPQEDGESKEIDLRFLKLITHNIVETMRGVTDKDGKPVLHNSGKFKGQQMTERYTDNEMFVIDNNEEIDNVISQINALRSQV